MFDKSLQLPPSPKPQKWRKTDSQLEGQDGHALQGVDPTQLQQYLLALGQLVLRHDHSLSLLQSTDSFILFFQQDKEGSLPGLLQETQKWQMQRQQSPTQKHPTLRQHLSQWFLLDMLNRVTKVSVSKPGEPLYQACLEKNLIQEDMSWTYLRWDAAQKKLLVDKKKAVSMAKMLQHMQELIEDFKDPTLVVKFQGLATSTQQPTIPWKLQLNMRMDRPYDLLHTLTHNAVWLLAGTSLKVHSTQPSQLTRQVQNMLPQTKGRGKGKSKHKGKAQAAPSP
jgi:hypothetical protein